MRAVCKSSHLPVVKPDERSSVGYDRSPCSLFLPYLPVFFFFFFFDEKLESDGDGFVSVSHVYTIQL